MSKECESCYYFYCDGDSPETVEPECHYVPNESNDYDEILPCEVEEGSGQDGIL